MYGYIAFICGGFMVARAMGDLTRIANNHIGWTQEGVAVFLVIFTIFAGIAIPLAIHLLRRTPIR